MNICDEICGIRDTDTCLWLMRVVRAYLYFICVYGFSSTCSSNTHIRLKNGQCFSEYGLLCILSVFFVKERILRL